MLQENLRKLRDASGRTQEEVANKLGISRARYSHYENGRRQPDRTILKAISELYDVSLDVLLENDVMDSSRNKTEPTNKEEKDIAKRLEAFKRDIENSDGLAFDGEPISEEAKESLIEAMEHIYRQTQRLNKKYIPKKYRDEE